MFQINIVEKIKKNPILCSMFFFKSYLLWDNVEKQSRAGQTTDNNMVHVPCMLDTYGYKHTQNT
jgi:hypothetical protein